VPGQPRDQSAYYVATGIAPFVSRRAFEAFTGLAGVARGRLRWSYLLDAAAQGRFLRAAGRG
jgi:hypothetical protein